MEAQDKWPFVPLVKKVWERSGAFNIPPEGLTVYAGKEAIQAAKWFAVKLSIRFSITVQIVEDNFTACLLRICPTLENNLFANAEEDDHAVFDQQKLQSETESAFKEHSEGYACYVSENGIVIHANEYRGYLYGWFSLEQWIEKKSSTADGLGSIPCIAFADWPDLQVRGIHFDFKGSVPYMSYVVETIERLAHLKINTLLIEYENQFPYSNVLHVHKRGGYMKGEIEKMLDCAKLYGMEVIPFVQSLGHVDYVLKHDDYAHLREDGITFQYCPSHPGSMELFKRMVDELIDCHPDSRYVHIGADETMALGRCDRCRQWIAGNASSGVTETRTKIDLYMKYLKSAAGYVISKGKKPMIWDDMFHSEKCIDRMSELPVGTAVCSWSYYDHGRSNWVWWAGKYYTSKLWLEQDPGAIPQMNWLEDLPMDEQDKIRTYWDKGEYPLYGNGNIPWVREYVDQGLEVFGASCVRGADHTNSWIARQKERVDNAAFWPKYAVETGIKGVFATAWSRFYSLSPPIEPWETGWYPQAAHACFSWGAFTQKDHFDIIFTQTFAEGDHRVLKAIQLMDKGAETLKIQYYFAAQQLLEACTMKNSLNQRYVKFLQSSAWFSEISLQLEVALKEVEWMLYSKKDRLPSKSDVILQRGLDALKSWLNTAERWEISTLALCKLWMPKIEAEQLVLNKLYPYKIRSKAVF